MQTFNAITSRIFDVVLAPFGHRAMWFDLLFWPIVAGIAALLIYKAVSNQKGIADAKRRIMVNLLEVVLYRENVLGVLVSTAKGLAQNVRYLGYNILPMLVMIVPMNVRIRPMMAGTMTQLVLRSGLNSTWVWTRSPRRLNAATAVWALKSEDPSM